MGKDEKPGQSGRGFETAKSIDLSIQKGGSVRGVKSSFAKGTTCWGGQRHHI